MNIYILCKFTYSHLGKQGKQVLKREKEMTAAIYKLVIVLKCTLPIYPDRLTQLQDKK